MRIFFKEIRDDILRYFGYVPKTLFDTKLEQVIRKEGTLHHNMRVMQTQTKHLDTCTTIIRIWTERAFIDDHSDVETVSLKIDVMYYVNHKGETAFETGDPIIAKTDTVTLATYALSEFSLQDIDKTAEHIAKVFNVPYKTHYKR